MSIQLVKDYNVQGRELTVEVGRATELDDGTIFAWSYKILVKGHLIQDSVYHWDTTKRPLTNTNVANHLASFWANSPGVIEAQQFPESDEIKLNKLVFKCADFMHQYYNQEDSFRDFEIVNKFMDGNGWEITLSPNYLEGRLLEFSQQTSVPHVIVVSYIKDREFNTVL